MFTTEHFRRPSLHETISHLCFEKTRHVRFLPYEFMPVESVQLKCQFLVKTSILIFFWHATYQRARTFTHARTECLNKREKRSTSRHRRWSVVPNVRSLLDAVGPSLLSATDLASRYGIEGEICRPLNHMRQIPSLLTAPNRSCRFNVRLRSLLYSREKSFCLSYGRHWSGRLQSARTRPA